MEPAFIINHLLGFVFHVEVAHEYVPSPKADLPTAIRVWTVNHRLATAELFSTT